MQRVSPLERARLTESARLEAAVTEVGSVDSGALAADSAEMSDPDRRVTESNRAWLGRVVDGRYRVIEVVGRGGMGVVYKVEHLRMGKIAAMKVLHRDLVGDPEVMQRFEREALAVSRLNHPNTVQVFDFGSVEGALYLIMEHVRGQDLARVVERDGALPFARAAPLFVQICGALQEAHELGIVHRDLKPENVLVTRSTGGRDFAKVLDFGLVKLSTREAAPDMTDRAQIVGTPYFMSPEQIRGDEVDARADIYSLGALMFRVLTGQYLYTAKSAVGVLTKHLTSEIDKASARRPDLQIDSRVDHIVAKALAKDPADRWQSVAELAAALEIAFTDVVGDATAVPRSRPSSAWLGEDEPVSELRLRRSDLDRYESSLRRRRWIGLGAGALAVLGAAGAAAYLLLREPATRRAEREPNHELVNATRIALATPVTATIGRRLSRAEPDRDLFRVVGTGAQELISVSVSGLPNMDLYLSVRSLSGAEQARVDEAGVGGGEVLRRRRVDGPIIVEIGQHKASDGAPAIENVSDEYTVRVERDQADPGRETEPNNSAADATPLVSGRAVSGALDARNDDDVLRWTGADGTYQVTVAAVDLPLVWTGPDGVARPPGAVALPLRTGELIRLARTDRAAARTDTLPGVDGTWTVTISVP